MPWLIKIAIKMIALLNQLGNHYETIEFLSSPMNRNKKEKSAEFINESSDGFDGIFMRFQLFKSQKFLISVQLQAF